MVAAAGETWKMDQGSKITASENIVLVPPARPADEGSTLVRTANFGQPKTPARETALEAIPISLSSRPTSPLSTPPKAPAMPPANANSGGGTPRNGASTPNAGMGGGGPTGGGGGPGQTNANQFVGVNFGETGNVLTAPAAQAATPPAETNAAAATAASASAASSPTTVFQTTYSMTPPTRGMAAYEPMSVSMPNGQGYGHGHNGSDPLEILNLNTGETVPANVTLNTFSTWGENLLAQVSGGAVSSYAWNVSQAPDLTNVSGSNTANLQGTWKSYTGVAHTDIISVTETPQHGSPLTVTMTFDVASTSSPAYSSTRPTSSSTWPTVLTPDQIDSGQATQGAGPYASLGLADGSVQTSFAMPSYNSSAAPGMSSGCT